MAWFKQGYKDYIFGNHPLWEILRSIYQMGKKPFVVGGILLFFGFVSAGFKRTKRPISVELMKFVRGEQMNRLKKIGKVFK